MGDSALLLTKIAAPRIRPGHVHRPDLVARLDDALDRRLTLVSAPAGWGKTSVLAEWLATHEDATVAWLSLDEEDNDPAHFWAYVAAALRGAGIEIPRGFEAAVEAPGTPVSDAALPILINALALCGREHVLVLDDFQVVSEPAIHAGVRYLLAHLPRASHAVIATRVEPPVGVARLRARGDLAEIATEQLRFSDAEAATLLNETLDLALASADLEALSARTEGWAAGLYLAGLSIRDRDAAPRAVDRHLVDYLGDEVVSEQAPQARSFLLDTCVLERFCAPLCDAVRGDGASRRILSDIERANLFLVPLDDQGEWFRYHHVFRDVLRRELHETGAAEHVAQLHARAAEWWAAGGDVSSAIAHLLAAGHVAQAADLIAASWNAALQSGRSATALRWLDALPADVVTGDPRLSLACAWLALDSGDQAAAERWADTTAAADDGRPLPEGGATVASGVAMLRAILAYRSGDLRAAEELGTGGRARERAGFHLARGRAGHAGSGAPLPRRPVRGRRGAARAGRGDRARRRQQHGRAARAGRAWRRWPWPPATASEPRSGSPPPTSCDRSSRCTNTGWARWRRRSPVSSPPATATSSARVRCSSGPSYSRGAGRRGPSTSTPSPRWRRCRPPSGRTRRPPRRCAPRGRRSGGRRAPGCSRTCSTTSIAACAAGA